jgi:hypothetical protein
MLLERFNIFTCFWLVVFIVHVYIYIMFLSCVYQGQYESVEELEAVDSEMGAE